MTKSKKVLSALLCAGCVTMAGMNVMAADYSASKTQTIGTSVGSAKTTVKATRHTSGNTKWTSYDTVVLNSPGDIKNYYTSEKATLITDKQYQVNVTLNMTNYNYQSGSKTLGYTFNFNGSKVY